MISITDLAMQYGQKTLFENASLNFDPGKRYGLVGANGSGKSTLLRIISGEELPSKGLVSIPKNLSPGLLKQDHFRYENVKVSDVVLQGNPRLWNAFSEKEQLLAENNDDEESGNRLAHLEVIIAEEDGYAAEAQVEEMLSGLGIGPAYHHGPMKALSGGFKLRVLLGQLLFAKPSLLMLDEPTNHLDIVSIRWLENFLVHEYQGTLIFISHDRNFLNAVSTHMLDIDYQELRLYPGNYDQFLEAKALNESQKQKEIESLERKTAEMQAFVERFRYKATKARQAQSRVKQLEKMEIPEITRSSRIYPKLKFEQERPSGRITLTSRKISKQFAEIQVLNGINFKLERGEKIAVSGPNGIGKSTLLKILLGELESDQGDYEWGYETSISYFAQDHHENLKGRISAYDWLYQFGQQENIGTIRGLLGRVLLSGDEALKSVSSLSGGEAARLLFAKIMLEKRNVLVLDEPTNHLDLEGVEALAQALKDFPGTVIVVSHDRHFVSEVATHVLELTPEGARDFAGSYQEYLEHFGDDYLSRDQALSQTRESKKPYEFNGKQRNRKELKKLISKLTRETNLLEETISDQEAQIRNIDLIFSGKDFFKNADNRKIENMQTSKIELEQELKLHMREWETKTHELEEARTEFEN